MPLQVLARLDEALTACFEQACALNVTAKHRWHRNLADAEAQMVVCGAHAQACSGHCGSVARDHLDPKRAKKRLAEVASRLGPLLSKINAGLPNIREGPLLLVHAGDIK